MKLTKSEVAFIEFIRKYLEMFPDKKLADALRFAADLIEPLKK